MKPDSNPLARLYGTTKTHKVQNLEDITVRLICTMRQKLYWVM